MILKDSPTFLGSTAEMNLKRFERMQWRYAKWRRQVRPFTHPLDKPETRTFLKSVKGAASSTFWACLQVTPAWDKVASPKKYLFAIEDSGRGAYGRVWLTERYVCSNSL